ncbi:MAG: hypothetical protein Q7R95_11010 [bacterium]|nr:hypothetical protein [bacterium]
MKTKQFNKIIKKLQEKFKIREDVNRHYNYDIIYNNKVIRWVERSHSLKDRHDKYIADNLDLNLNQLNRFITCTLSCEEYLNMLVQKGHIKQS